MLFLVLFDLLKLDAPHILPRLSVAVESGCAVQIVLSCLFPLIRLAPWALNRFYFWIAGKPLVAAPLAFFHKNLLDSFLLNIINKEVFQEVYSVPTNKDFCSH